MKKKKDNKILKTIISLLFLIITGVLLFSIHRLNIVPTKYMILGTLVLVFINLIAIICLFSKKKWPKVFTVLIYLFIIAITVFGVHFTNVTNNFLNNAFNTEIQTYSLKFYIMSPNEHKEEDLNGKDIVYYDNSQYVKDAIKKLNEKHTANMVLSDDLTTIYNNEFFLIDDATLGIFEEELDFDSTKYHIIYTIDLEYKVEPKKTEVKGKHYYNIFVGAYDFSNKNMDLNKIVTVNTETNEILITNIHRFAYLEVPGYNKKNRLSSMSTFSFENNIKALEKEFDITLDYYIIAKSTGLVTLVDDIGGIEYCSDKEFTTFHAKVINTYDDSGADHVHIKKGCQHLDGIETLTVGRERMAFRMGATERDKNTTAIMIDILEQMKKPSNISNYAKILNDLGGMYNTSIPREVITSSAKKLLNDGWSIKTITVNGTNGTNNIQFSNMKGSVYYLTPSSVNEVKARIQALNK
jgi:anionic cell wall polymer biosynthesis LytR-Cps2A-Psr (LCP) family protein